MKQLIIVRHAKSSWNAPLRDFDRPLTSNGIHDAHLVSSEISKHIPKMYLLWSSSAKRAAETAVIFAQNISFPVESIVFKEELYTFDGKKLEEIIKSCPDLCDNLIVFGHNEAITNFVNKFGSILIDNVSTSGFVLITFETNSWRTIKKGITNKVIFPRDLK
jgi:phosphohistidine phosphatase